MGTWCSNSNTVYTEERPESDEEKEEKKIHDEKNEEKKQKNKESEYSPLPSLPLPSLSDMNFSLKLFYVEND